MAGRDGTVAQSGISASDAGNRPVTAATVAAAFHDAVRAWHDRPFLCVADETAGRYHISPGEMTYGAAARAVAALTVAYRAARYGVGHRVGLMFENRPATFLHWLALNRIGASVVPLGAELRPAELAYLVQHSGICLAVGTAAHLARLHGCAAAADDGPLPPAPSQPHDAEPNATTECALVYTSGTTGKPKGCVLSNDYFLRCGRWYAGVGGLCALRPGDERLLTPLPMTHMNAMAYSTVAMVLTGGCIVLLDRFHPRSWWRTVRESGATIVHYLGVMPAMLLGSIRRRTDRAHSCEVRLRCRRRPATPRGVRAALRLSADRGLGDDRDRRRRVVIASHEPRHIGQPLLRAAGSHHGVSHRRRWRRRRRARTARRIAGSRRRRRPAARLLLRVSEDEAASHRSAGPAAGSTPATSCAATPTATSTSSIAGRTSSGAAARTSPRSRSRACSPAPAVSDVAGAAVPDDLRGEEVLACIVPREAGRRRRRRAPPSIVAHALRELAYFKAPGYVAFVDALPLTGDQKVQRGELKAWAQCLPGTPRLHRHAPSETPHMMDYGDVVACAPVGYDAARRLGTSLRRLFEASGLRGQQVGTVASCPRARPTAPRRSRKMSGCRRASSKPCPRAAPVAPRATSSGPMRRRSECQLRTAHRPRHAPHQCDARGFPPAVLGAAARGARRLGAARRRPHSRVLPCPRLRVRCARRLVRLAARGAAGGNGCGTVVTQATRRGILALGATLATPSIVRAAGDAVTIGWPSDVPLGSQPALRARRAADLQGGVRPAARPGPEAQADPAPDQELGAGAGRPEHGGRAARRRDVPQRRQDDGRGFPLHLLRAHQGRRRSSTPRTPGARCRTSRSQSPTKAVMKFNSPAPTAPQWLAFLGSYVVPKDYIERVGVEPSPEADRHRALQAGRIRAQFPHRARAQRQILGAEAEDRRVTIEIIKDPSARVAAIQSGQVDLTINRAGARGAAFAGRAGPRRRARSDHPRHPAAGAQRPRLRRRRTCGSPRTTPSTRRRCRRRSTAAQRCRCRCSRRPARPAICPTSSSTTTRSWPRQLLAKSGFGPDKPAKIGFAATNGQFPSDYDIARAIVQMWKKVGIDADLEVIEYAKYFELNRGAQAAGGDALQLGQRDRRSGDLRRLLLNPKMPFSPWKDMEIGQQGARSVQRRRYQTRIDGWKALDRERGGDRRQASRCCRAC